MNELRVFAKFKTVTTEEKRKIETEMRAFLLDFAPQADLKIVSGSGSWWIMVSGIVLGVVGWIALQFASWSAKKGFDHLAAKATEVKNSENLKEKENTLERQALPVTTEPSIGEQVSREEAFSHLADMGSKLSGLAERVGANQISFGEWSGVAGCGRIVFIRRDGNELTLSVYQTDSREDFDSRTTHEWR
jgi:hypothetical protein